MTDRSLYPEASALLARLYRALDEGDADGLADCFTPDGVWHRSDGPKSGDGLRSIVLDRPADRKTSHVPSNLVISREGDRVIGRYYLTVYLSSAKQHAQLFCCWDCEDVFDDSEEVIRIADKRVSMRMQFAQA